MKSAAFSVVALTCLAVFLVLFGLFAAYLPTQASLSSSLLIALVALALTLLLGLPIGLLINRRYPDLVNHL
jgi:hypothetical protein